MNRYLLGLLCICSAAALYGQNPRAYLVGRNLFGREMIGDVVKSSSHNAKFDAQLIQANRDYERLSAAEKELCDLVGKSLAIRHARELCHIENQADLIPTAINPKQDVDQITAAFTRAQKKANVSEDRLSYINQIGYVRLSALWKQKADQVGKKCTWCSDECDDNKEDDVSC